MARPKENDKKAFIEDIMEQLTQPIHNAEQSSESRSLCYGQKSRNMVHLFDMALCNPSFHGYF